ncbi:flagellar hook capping FlgD N-terminal domain-containing protein [Nocardioides daejeonensis]|uniref:flagellar hook capping FlgD N-terminal domain-containing protein n=1 Tax=Nocardioides daejeonensis TaxID=1046556 RepID=UPI000D7435D3|nr:flagellar hook capping FlgD N-terminal domain-containing protein [Nocardioides daejeonensis]
MSIPATEAVTSGMLSPLPVSTATSEDKQMFLELMVAQLRYQDPLNPADSGEFLSQTAQFNALEQMTKVAEQTATLVATQLAFGATGMIGRDVTWAAEDGSTSSGRVDGVTFTSEGPMLQVGGGQVPLALVQSLSGSGATPAAPAAPSTDTTTPA